MSLIITNEDRELVLQLLEDVEVISDALNVVLPKPVVIRSTFVPLLRKWIVEGGFFKAASLIRPHRPTFEIITGSNEVNLCKSGVYEHWMALIVFGSIGVGSALLSERYRKNPPITAKSVSVSHLANAFFTQKMFFWKGKFYSRQDIIWMHANRLGGVHLDFRRTADEGHINEIKNYFGFEVLPHTHQMLIGQDIESARADAARRDRVYDAAELVAMDTASIFAKGITVSRPFFEAVL